MALVVSHPPRPAGRGKRPRPTAVADEAERLELPLLLPCTAAKAERGVAEVQSDIGVVVDYGQLLPDSLLALPRHGFINVHPSLLPRWRGAAPIERAMLAGDSETGVSILRVTSELDAGPLAAQRTVPVRPDDTSGGLRNSLAELGAEMLASVLEDIEAGSASFQPQSGEGIAYADKIAPLECRVDWTASAWMVARRVQALSPTPGAWCTWHGKRLRLLAAAAEEGDDAAPGTMERGCVACGEGWLRLLRVQPEGRREMDAEAWLRGVRAAPDSRLA